LSGYGFAKYLYPNTHRDIIIKTLEHFEFKYDYRDEINTYLKKDGLPLVPVTNEDIVKSLNIYEIINQSGVPDEEFSKILNQFRKQVAN